MYSQRECTKCGDTFVPQPKNGGRPRTRCYKCSPERNAETKAKPGASTVQQGGQNNDMAELNSADRRVRREVPRQESTPGVHCAWCGAYTDGAPFCNPSHRSLFTQKVADVRNGGESITLSDAKRLNANRERKRAASEGPKRSPLQRARDNHAEMIRKSKVRKAAKGAV